MIHAFLVKSTLVLALTFGVGTLWAQAPTPLTRGIQKSDTPAEVNAESSRSLTPSQPLRLTPKRSAPLAVSRSAVESPSTGDTTQKTSLRSPTYSSIQVEGLQDLDSGSIGSLTEGKGGFGTDMWRGTPRTVIERLIPKLPYAISSPVLRDLSRRLLLSSAAIPPWPQNAAKKPSRSLIATRIALLQAMGRFKDARNLIALTPGRGEDIELLRLQAEDKLYANDYGNACQVVASAGDQLALPYWQRLLVFCQTLQGDSEGAALGASLLADSIGAEDPAFFELIDHLTKASDKPLASLRNPNALHLAAMRTAQMTIPDDALSTRSPAILRTIGVSPNARLDTRLAAAENAVELGALSSERLAEIYMGEKFNPDELNNALSLAAADRSPRGRALLFQAAQIESVSMAKAAVISKAFEIATEENRYLHVIDLYRQPLADLAAGAEMTWFAAEAARALYALDRPLPARTWAEELRRAAARNAEFQPMADGLWFLANLNDSAVSAENFDTNLRAWLKFHTANQGPDSTRRASAGLRLLQALGYEIPGDVWWPLLDTPQTRAATRADPTIRAALGRAGSANRRAETVLLTLIAFGNEGPYMDDIDTAVVAVTALRQVGLEDEAKNLVLEFAAKSGI